MRRLAPIARRNGKSMMQLSFVDSLLKRLYLPALKDTLDKPATLLSYFTLDTRRARHPFHSADAIGDRYYRSLPWGPNELSVSGKSFTMPLTRRKA